MRVENVPAYACCCIVVAGGLLVAAQPATLPTRAQEPAPADPHAPGLHPLAYQCDGNRLNAVVFVPEGYTADEQWPLIVFLHGAARRGDDGWSQSEVGLGKLVRDNPGRLPALVLMPQAPEASWWGEVNKVVGDTDDPRTRERARRIRTDATPRIDAALKRMLDAYSVDETRIYLTGQSMGGFGTWIHGARRIDRFAALLPICGGGDPADAKALARRPIWAFHGDQDQAVPVERTREMVEAVRAAGGAIRYTEFEGARHGIWNRVYGDPAVLEWLLRQRLDTSED